jgi:hypothetical protein
MRSAECGMWNVTLVLSSFRTPHSAFITLLTCCLNNSSEGRAPRGPESQRKRPLFWGLAELGLPNF